MPNQKVLTETAEQRRRLRPRAERAYRNNHAQVPALIMALAGTTQATHDRAYDLLTQMSPLIVDELVAALGDPTLDADAADEAVSLLGLAADERAREPLWEFFEGTREAPERALTAALSLAVMGDERVLPFLREELDSPGGEQVLNAASGMIVLGKLEDIPHLRAVHQRHGSDREIRDTVVAAIMAILAELDEHTLNRTLDDIQTRFSDRELWTDIWAELERSFGGKKGRPR